MLKASDKKRSVLFTILGIFVLLAAITGGALAVLVFNYTGDKNTISTGNISISFLETTDVIDIDNALPITDQKALSVVDGVDVVEPFNFSVTTSASGTPGTMAYTIYAVNQNATDGYERLSDNQVKIYLASVNGDTVSQVLPPTLISNLSPYTEQGVVKGKELMNTGRHVHNTINDTITTNYFIKMWIDNDVLASNWDENTKLEYKIKIGVYGSLIAV